MQQTLFLPCFSAQKEALKTIMLSPKQQILDSSKLKKFANDHFKFDSFQNTCMQTCKN